MKNRTIDLALIVGLVLVAGAIVWTLFSLGGTPGGSLPGAGPGAGPTASDGAAGSEGSGGTDGPGIVPVDPNDGRASAGGTAPGGDAPGGDAPNGNVAPLAPGDSPAGGDTGLSGESVSGTDGATSTTDVDGGSADDGPDAQAQGEQVSDDQASDDQASDVRVPAAEAPPVPDSGPVDLGRIGFSFVTGGAGACGIVLEPWTHVAVSRELLEAYGCGAEVTITLDDPTDGRTQVAATVADTMNPSFSRTVNMYVGEDEPALAYGLTTGTITPR